MRISCVSVTTCVFRNVRRLLKDDDALASLFFRGFCKIATLDNAGSNDDPVSTHAVRRQPRIKFWETRYILLIFTHAQARVTIQMSFQVQ